MTPFEVIKQKYKPLFAWEDFMRPEIKFAGYRPVLLVTIDQVSVMMLPGRYTKKDYEKIRKNVMSDIITWIEVMAKRPDSVEIDFAAPDSMDRFDEAMRTFAFLGSVRPADVT